ncbi:hypothetical protein ABZ897_51840 [Nonomuraea sp. NPDC046802]|uniref:hypothetical protein n=1 Tax=Nonomuraea sp. NPDC046802 TaxID=3154919 RepID=UPI0033FD64BD
MFATLIVTCAAPWMVIMMLGYVTRPADVTRRCRKSVTGASVAAARFSHSWHRRGLAARPVLAGSVLTFVNLPGPVVNLAVRS